MKVYIAGKYQNKLLLQCLMYLLKSTVPNTEFLCDWVNGEADKQLKERTDIDYGQIKACDVVLATHPSGEGTASEMGYGLGLGKVVLYFVDKEFLNDTCILPVGALPENNIIHNIHHLVNKLKKLQREGDF